MILWSRRYGNVEFGKVCCAVGARNFQLQDYWYGKLLRFRGYNWQGSAFASKTTPFYPRQGNMVLRSDGVTPREFNPRCICVDFSTGHALNAVSWSSLGMPFLMANGLWQQITSPFYISIGAVGDTRSERMHEIRMSVDLLESNLDDFRAPVALILSWGCPNVEMILGSSSLQKGREPITADEILEAHYIASRPGIPILDNFAPTVDLGILIDVAQYSDGLWIANTIEWGTPGIDFEGIFGTKESPLIKRGFKQAGGLSGPACLPFTMEKIKQVREAGIGIPIVAGNGIQSVCDAAKVLKYAHAIAIGIVAIVRTQQMQRIIQYVNEIRR